MQECSVRDLLDAAQAVTALVRPLDNEELLLNVPSAEEDLWLSSKLSRENLDSLMQDTDCLITRMYAFKRKLAMINRYKRLTENAQDAA